jgi:UDP-3-O-[3-hydroxymyristoyl] N-acetylglucosamine deacetylase
MSLHKQKTVKKKIQLTGVGLHSGKIANLNIKPAKPNTGIIFIRTDLKNNNEVIPHVNNVSSAVLCTTISNEYGVKISTLEHLMGALFGLGVDNAIIELDSEEVPILDGSAKVFVEEILKVGLEVSNTPIKVIRINNKINFKDGNKSISIEPSKVNLEIDFELVYENKLIGNQKNKFQIYEDELTDVFNSRTFCLFEDIEKLRKIGLAKGGSLDNAIVVKDDEILNESGLRNKKEFVNHKILDCMGDIYLSGYRIIGKIKCSQGGHKLTNDLMRKVFEKNDNFSLVEINEKNLPNAIFGKQYLKSIA